METAVSIFLVFAVGMLILKLIDIATEGNNIADWSTLGMRSVFLLAILLFIGQF